MYADTLREADEISKPLIEKDEPLDEAERSKALVAIKLYDSLSAYQPTKVGLYFVSGKLHMLRGEDAEAEAKLVACLNAKPSDLTSGDPQAVALTAVEAHYLLSQIYFRAGKFQEAYDDANAAAKAEPMSPNYLTARAAAAVQLGKLAEAKRDVAGALLLDPSHSAARSLKSLMASP